jgi:general secretion pathway protein A
VYTAYYNLREEPFRLTSDPKFFHLASPHAAALATLVEAVMRRKGFVLMSGPIGTGKTTVLHAALQILAERSPVGNPIASAFVHNPTLNREEFLEMILTEFEIPCAGNSKPVRLAALHQMLLKTQREGSTAVLLVDEAHLLSSDLLEEIRLLSNMDTYAEKLLQIVLCGQPELLTVLNRPELRALQQRVATSCALRPLSFPEMRAYIAERLHAAGFRGTTSPFPGPALEGIYNYTRGVARIINLLCDACLSIGCKTQRPVVQLDMVEQAAAELALRDTVPVFVDQKRVVAPAYVEEPVSVAVPVSVVQKRVVAPAYVEEPVSVAVPIPVVERQAAVPVVEKEPVQYQVVESAVDMMIRAMKQRRSYTRGNE